jgi:hypothetical protein
MQGKTVEVDAVEGRPPKTIDVPDQKGGACRYCLTQEGMTAAYTFLYASSPLLRPPPVLCFSRVVPLRNPEPSGGVQSLRRRASRCWPIHHGS